MASRLRPNWSLHDPILSSMINTTVAEREQTDTQYGEGIAQVDEQVREWLAMHNIDTYLEGNQAAAFVALTVAEFTVNAFKHGVVSAMQCADGDLEHLAAHIAVLQSGMLQRFAWLASLHAPEYKGKVPEPFKNRVSLTDLPSLNTLAAHDDSEILRRFHEGGDES